MDPQTSAIRKKSSGRWRRVWSTLIFVSTTRWESFRQKKKQKFRIRFRSKNLRPSSLVCAKGTPATSNCNTRRRRSRGSNSRSTINRGLWIFTRSNRAIRFLLKNFTNFPADFWNFFVKRIFVKEFHKISSWLKKKFWVFVNKIFS